MALNLSTLAAFIGRITAADSNYPYGSSKNETASGAGDGTPYIKSRADDLFGFQQAMLTEAGVVPSGTADTAINSQYLESLRIVLNVRTTIHNIGSNADYTLTTTQNKFNRFVITDTGVILTTTRNIIVGTAQKRFLVQNNTTQSLVFKTSAGTGITVFASRKVDLYCDGKNVIEIGSDAIDINSRIDKTTPVDTDSLVLQESGGLLLVRKISWANFKASLLTYFDTFYLRTTAIFGIGQSWQNMTGSRNSGSTYTNSTGKLIKILLSGTTTSSGHSITNITVNGTVISLGQGSSQGVGTAFACTTGEISIPNGATYSATFSMASFQWFEFR